METISILIDSKIAMQKLFIVRKDATCDTCGRSIKAGQKARWIADGKPIVGIQHAHCGKD